MVSELEDLTSKNDLKAFCFRMILNQTSPPTGNELFRFLSFHNGGKEKCSKNGLHPKVSYIS